MIIENLGPIKSLELKLNKFTIFLGENNTGKTYISYLIYGIMKKALDIRKLCLDIYVEEILKLRNFDGKKMVINKEDFREKVSAIIASKVNSSIGKELPKIFNLPEQSFHSTNIKISSEDIKVLDSTFELDLNNFIEDPNGERRVGFHFLDVEGELMLSENDKEITFEFTNLTPTVSDEAFNESINLQDLKQKIAFKHISIDKLKELYKILIPIIYMNQHPQILYLPAERNGINVFKNELIKKRVDESFNLENILNNSSFHDLKSNPESYPLVISDYMKFINKISFKETNRNNGRKIGEMFNKEILKGDFSINEVTNEVYFEGTNSGDLHKVPLKISSSSIKSLYGLEYYLNRMYNEGDYLFIDEPEMNLDPRNQVDIVKFMMDLETLNIKILISTHSDYLVRSITNELLKYKLEDKKTDFVSVYYFTHNRVEKLDDLTENNFIRNFDDVNISLEEDYLALLEQIDEHNFQ